MMMPPVLLAMILIIPTTCANVEKRENNMTSNTDDPKYDNRNASDDDSASPDSLILDSSLKHKINPKWMLKQKTKMTVIDADAATKNASLKAINTAPCATNTATSPDADSTTA